MVKKIQGTHDDALTARVVRSTPLTYEQGASPELDRPSHVRAASSLSPFLEQLAVVQDDANFLAVVDPVHHSAWSIKLPASESGYRVFDEERGNRGNKLDLEACVAVPGTNNRLLIALGSGSRESREWVMIVDWRHDGDEPDIDIYEADSLFLSLRKQEEFAGARLNIEGAVFVDDDTLRIFQRGNYSSPEPDGPQPVDAIGDLSWVQIRNYLPRGKAAVPPSLRNVVQYELGSLGNTRLTFSDAARVENVTLFSASAERDGRSDGAALGVIDADGTARYTELIDIDGTIFTGKIEGLSVDPEDAHHVWFVIDDDVADQPSNIYEAELSGPWYARQ